MADKYEPTTDIHNIFIFVLVPIIIHVTLSNDYKKFMKKIRIYKFIVLLEIYLVLPTLLYSYRSNFFEVFGKTRFIIIYFALPLIAYLFSFLVFAIIFSFKDENNSKLQKNQHFRPIVYFLTIFFFTYDFIVNIYYFSFFCQTTFKTDAYLYIVVPLACLYSIALLDTFKKFKKAECSILFIICFILKSFVVTTLISSSTIVTNTLLTFIIIPVFHTYYFFEERKSYLSSGRSKKLKKLVEELTAQDNNPASNPGDTDDLQFIGLYKKIQDNYKDKEKIREVIHFYYSFGKALKDRLDHHKKYNKKLTARALVNEEVRNQLSEAGDILVLQVKERAKMIYDFFNEIGKDKIEKVKSFSAVEISELSSDDIDYVFVQLAKRDDSENCEDKKERRESDDSTSSIQIVYNKS